jgi:hypothetical protein
MHAKKKAKSTAKHSKKRSSRHRSSGSEKPVWKNLLRKKKRLPIPFFSVDSTTKKLTLKDPLKKKTARLYW